MLRAIQQDRTFRKNLVAYTRYLLTHPGALMQPRPTLGFQRPPYLGGAPKLLRSRLAVPASHRLSWGSADTAPPASLRLAGVTFDLADEGQIDWAHPFDDREDQAALHRFAWLLPWLVDRSCDGSSADSVWAFVVASINSWQGAHTAPDDTEIWQSYTVTERLVNWILAAIACGRDLPCHESTHAQATHIQSHLEYYGDRLTGNHLSNDGRALYLSGVVLGDARLAHDGRTILIAELARLFDADGFLREDSTHYQFLVTRNYCEALWMARHSSDEATVSALVPAVANMTRACFSLLVRTGDGGWTLPLLGDVSPDCTPQWLIGVPWAGAALTGTSALENAPNAGWQSLFPDAVPATEPAMPLPEGRPAWARADLGDWTCVTHANPGGTPRQPSHAHNDTGGVVIFHRGDLVVMDCGRRTYNDDEEGRFGQRAPSHSVVLVDEAEPAAEWRWYLAPAFLERQSGIKPRLTSGADFLTIESGGGSITPGVGMRRRRIAVRANGDLEIVDEIDGRGTHEIAVIFHLPATTQLRDEVLEISLDGRTVRLSLDASLQRRQIFQAPDNSPTFGWAAGAYGDKQPITTVVASARVPLPWRGVSVMAAVPQAARDL